MSSNEAFVMETTDMLETDPAASEQWKVFTDKACQGHRDPQCSRTILEL